MTSILLREIRFHRLDMQTRFPFRYGIASMTYAPHLFVTATVEVDGRLAQGCSADGLPPKWFTKHPDTSFEEDDLPAMLRVIRHAADTALAVGRHTSFFNWWRALYQTQHDWAGRQSIAPLLAGLGVSLVERAALDAVCRAAGKTLFEVLHGNLLGIDLGALSPNLVGVQPCHVLPAQPQRHVWLRHTIGLGDPLTAADARKIESPCDGLPFTLEENVRTYGLSYFKIKLSGKQEIDRERLLQIASILDREVAGDAKFTLDGNENFQTMAQFRQAWNAFMECELLQKFFDRGLLFAEQPVHRTSALHPSVGEELRTWDSAPPIIIDESDAELTSLPTALELGYRGTSHKNCKGIIKGLLAAATLNRKTSHARGLILSAEDLGNVGPIALLQDLAMVAALGISHVERNGHHYFAGLSMFPEEVQLGMLAHHPDLYQRHAAGFAALAPLHGRLALGSVNAAACGLQPLFDTSQFTAWEF